MKDSQTAQKQEKSTLEQKATNSKALSDSSSSQAVDAGQKKSKAPRKPAVKSTKMIPGRDGYLQAEAYRSLKVPALARPTLEQQQQISTLSERERTLEEYKEFVRECRQFGPEALQCLISIIRNDKAHAKDRIAAAREVLDRGFGKPLQAIGVSVSDDVGSSVIVLPAIIQPDSHDTH